jgi:hypothetical protein
MLSAVITTAHGYSANTPGGIAETPEVLTTWSSRTEVVPLQDSYAYSR